jgi:hypothetical protein
MPENSPDIPDITPEEEARIAEADRAARKQAEELLGEKAAKGFFDVMDRKRAGED